MKEFIQKTAKPLPGYTILWVNCRVGPLLDIWRQTELCPPVIIEAVCWMILFQAYFIMCVNYSLIKFMPHRVSIVFIGVNFYS